MCDVCYYICVDVFLNDTATTEIDTSLHSLSLHDALPIYERSSFRSRSPSAALGVPLPDFVRGTAEITSAYGQLSVEPVDGLTLNGGIRYADHSRHGGQTLFAAGGGWPLPTGTVPSAGYGERFRAPGLCQLFRPYGKLGLHPADAHGWEDGV